MTNYRMREASGAGEWMMNAMTRNPEGLLLLAAGAALLMRSGRGQLARSSRPDSSQVEPSWAAICTQPRSSHLNGIY